MTLIKILLLLIVIIVLASVAFMYLAPQFGASPKGSSLQNIKQSPNYKNGAFVNLVDTKLDTRKPGESMEIASYFFPPADKNPSEPLKSVPFDKASLNASDFVWFGHSTVLFQTGDILVLTDPVFNRASPVPVGGKPFAMTEPHTVNDLPIVDVLIISHDHYDHLDHKAIADLASSTKLFLVPLGIQAHLERWGVPPEKIIELDWNETHRVADATFRLTPARHFSGRGITNRNSTLWGSWVIETSLFKVFFSGDSGYFDEFKRIGEQHGPFDIAFIENGAYDLGWSQVHMMPEQSVQAAMDLHAKVFFPIHWGKFDLAKHQWNEPIKRAIAAAEKHQLPVAAPLVGQVFQLDQPPFNAWWD